MRGESDGEESQQPAPHSTGPVSNGSTSSPLSTPLKASFINGSSKTESNGYTNGHALPRPTGSFFGHDREEVTRILIQSLTGLGYHGAAGALSKESGFELENPSVAAFRSAVQSGDWADAEALLFGSDMDDDDGGVGLRGTENEHGSLEWLKARPTRIGRPSALPLAEGSNKQEMLFWIRQQKYLELLEDRDLGTALMVLRLELTPLHRDTHRLHALSSLMMCLSADDLRVQAQWDGAAGNSRNHLLSQLSKSIAPAVMIPEHRLAVLFDQIQNSWVEQCLFHNTTNVPSLYHDHACEEDDFPLQVLLELREHKDEVWFVDFSHDGTMLATASKDNSVIVYDTVTWKRLYRFADHHGVGDIMGVCYVSWSPDDKYLLSCSQGSDLIVYDIKDGSRLACIDTFCHPVTTAAWAPDGQSFVVGSQDASKPLGVYTLADPIAIHMWLNDDRTTLRINDCSISADGTKLAAISNDNHILIYDFTTKLKLADWVMDDKLTCVNLSNDGKTFLISMNEGRLMLLDTETGDIIQRYEGLKQSEFIIRSAFGGAGENFVISGSEDSHIYIWRKDSGVQVAALEAHTPGTVNSVAWHPTRSDIFASAGDDGRVRIWSNSKALHERQPGLMSLLGEREYLR